MMAVLSVSDAKVQVAPLYKRGGAPARHPDYIAAGQALTAACGRDGSLAEVQRLLDTGADPNFEDDDAMQAGHKHAHFPLMQAVEAGSMAKVELLVHAGANITVSCRNGNTPLLHAVERAQHDLVAFLLQAGAPVDGHSDTIQTPLMIASTRGDVLLVDMLIRAGADVNYALSDGANAIHLAARARQTKVVATLLAHAEYDSLNANWRHASGMFGTPAEHTASLDIKKLIAAAKRRLGQQEL
jgi:hypothetical protein